MKIATPIVLEFRNYLEQVGYSAGTIYNLPRQVEEFLAYHPNQILHSLQQEHIRQFYDYLHIRPNRKRSGALSERMIAHFVYALRVFFAWLQDTGHITRNPISSMKFKRPRTNVRHPLSREEIDTLFTACTCLQETAMLHLFYSCGLRLSEVVGLNSRDIHFKQQLLYVRRGKGAKRRVVPLTTKVSQTLEAYYLEERRNRVNIYDAAAFILNQRGYRLRGSSYGKALKAIIRRTSINPQTSPHYLRHSIATHLLQAGVSVQHVRDFLGHRHLESTQIYAKVAAYQIKQL